MSLRQAFAQTNAPADDAAELAKKLSNPVAALISVPLQNNLDFGAGPAGDGFQYKLSIPVIPISVNSNWNVISRTILPYVYQEDMIGTSSQTGLSDAVQSLFFLPKEPTRGGWIWGAGPVFLLPTATDDLLGSEKWGIGPTAVVLKQQHGWTYGALVNHIWSFAGEDGPGTLPTLYLRSPSVTRILPSAAPSNPPSLPSADPIRRLAALSWDSPTPE